MIRQKDKIDHDNGLLGMVTSGWVITGGNMWSRVVANGYGWFGYGLVISGSTEKGEIGREGWAVSSRSFDHLNSMICSSR